ncbi:high-affinity nitrate transporter 3.2-like [Cryptomeria japonica]|uniref:high-affinity nitrate transporter 3.2-like n=1 Tax=Cryptomeria japonica TaxID=3369 RepID=UPI0025AC6E92|nr:high-affinity nitrate transporter 3.2-like [Cryptomeria japonica]
MAAVMRASVFVSWVLFSSYFIASAMAGVSFSTLPRTLVLTSAISSQDKSASNVARAGEDDLVVTWRLNESLAGGEVDSKYKSVIVKLCFAPVSQVERGWRKTNDDLKKDKTCQFKITEQPYSSNSNNTVTWTVEKDVPGAVYFVRAYALDVSGSQLAYGQTTNKNKTTNLFVVEPISGRHVSLDIAAGVFSAFSVVSLFGFFAVEKLRAKK